MGHTMAPRWLPERPRKPRKSTRTVKSVMGRGAVEPSGAKTKTVAGKVRRKEGRVRTRTASRFTRRRKNTSGDWRKWRRTREEEKKEKREDQNGQKSHGLLVVGKWGDESRRKRRTSHNRRSVMGRGGNPGVQEKEGAAEGGE